MLILNFYIAFVYVSRRESPELFEGMIDDIATSFDMSRGRWNTTIRASIDANWISGS